MRVCLQTRKLRKSFKLHLGLPHAPRPTHRNASRPASRPTQPPPTHRTTTATTHTHTHTSTAPLRSPLRLAVNDFRGRTGWACPVSGAPPGCEISGEEILTQLHFEGFTVAEAFMGLLLLTVGPGRVGMHCSAPDVPLHHPQHRAAVPAG